MSQPATLLAVFAHPDDESLAIGGTLARYAREGGRTALLCATRGEWGPISDDALADYETLGPVREQELRAACAALGIEWLRFVDLPDGGVSWAIEEPSEGYGPDITEKVVRAIRELRPQVVVTFGPDGMYGHDDHIAVGRLTVDACALAGRADAFPQHLAEGLSLHRPDRLFYTATPKGLMNRMVERLTEAGLPASLWDIPPDQFGIDPADITTTLDVADFVPQKLAALRCHRTQISAAHAFREIPLDIAREFLGAEHFRPAPGFLAADFPLPS